jgi:hypothetical protein
MNFRQLAFTFLLAAFCQPAFTQNVTLSTEEADEPGFPFVKVVGYDIDGYFVLLSNLNLNSSKDKVGFKHRRTMLRYYSHNLEKQWQLEIAPSFLDSEIDNVSFFNGRVLVISSRPAQNGSGLEFYYHFINNTGETSGNHLLTRFNADRSDREKSFIVQSASKGVFAVIMNEVKGNDEQSVHFASFSSEMNLLNNGAIDIPWGPKQYENRTFSVSEKGDLALLGNQSEKLRSTKKKVFNYLYVAPAGDSAITSARILPNRNVQGIGIAFNNFQDKLVLAGMHTDNRSTTGAAVFYSLFDFRNEKEPSVTSTLIEARYNQKLRGERNRNTGIGLANYNLERIIVLNDGGAVIVSEGSFTNEYSYYDYFTNTYTQTIEYVFGNIVIMAVAPDGRINWSNIVEKMQVSVNDEGSLSSFSHLLNSEEMVLFFNTDISRRNKVVYNKVDKLGELSKPQLLPALEGLLLVPRSGRQVSATGYVIPVYNRKKVFLAKIEF